MGVWSHHLAQDTSLPSEYFVELYTRNPIKQQGSNEIHREKSSLKFLIKTLVWILTFSLVNKDLNILLDVIITLIIILIILNSLKHRKMTVILIKTAMWGCGKLMNLCVCRASLCAKEWTTRATCVTGVIAVGNLSVAATIMNCGVSSSCLLHGSVF